MSKGTPPDYKYHPNDLPNAEEKLVGSIGNSNYNRGNEKVSRNSSKEIEVKSELNEFADPKDGTNHASLDDSKRIHIDEHKISISIEKFMDGFRMSVISTKLT